MVSTTTFLAAILAAALPLVSATPITPVAARAASPDPAPAPAPAPVPVPAPVLVDSNGDGGEIQNFTHFLLTARAAPRWISGPWWNFPDISTWLSFDDLFGRNMNSMHSTGSTWDDIGRINVAIRECAKLGVDERVILAIIMQESHGDVGVRTTTSPGGAATAGIMQCTGCPGFPGRHGLSQAEITSMVRGGTQHFKGNLRNWGDKWSGESIYPALREYNSGSVNTNDLSDGRGATASYVSDIAQRLQGWTD